MLLATGTAAQNPALLAKAQAGDAGAQNSLGDFYYGIGTLQGYAQAAVWYRKAAEQGYAKAEYSLGGSYCWREGVPLDYVEAYFWLDLAVEGKVDDVNHLRNYAASHLTPAELSQVQERARKWLESHPSKLARNNRACDAHPVNRNIPAGVRDASLYTIYLDDNG